MAAATHEVPDSSVTVDESDLPPAENAEASAEKKTPTPRKHYAHKDDRIGDCLGDKLSEYVASPSLMPAKPAQSPTVGALKLLASLLHS